MATKSKARAHRVSNPEFAAAMRDIGRSSGASRHRLRTAHHRPTERRARQRGWGDD